MAELSITSAICLFFHAGVVFVLNDLYNNYRTCLKAPLLSDVENDDGCILCEAGTELLCIVLVLRRLNMFLHAHFYFQQNFIFLLLF